MAADLTEGLTGSVDIEAQAKLHTELGRAGFHAILENPMIDDPRVYHVRYQDFVKDQVATIRGFYDFAGYELSEPAAQAMRDYLANNRGDRHGKFVYSTDLLDANLEELHEEFAPYRERFGLDIEKR